MKYFHILYNGDRYELWVDNFFVDEYRTWIEAQNEADRQGAVKRPVKKLDTSDAPY